MRDIKFRGFYPPYQLYEDMNSGWIYGYLIRSITENKLYIGVKGLDDVFEVEENSIGQYTGVNDKNGKEIYTEDIIRYQNKNYKVKKLKNGLFVGRCINNLTEEKDDKEILWIGPDSEVIGNIYENPEIIEVQE